MFDALVNAGALCSSILTSGENNLLHWFCYKAENDEHISLLNKILDQGCSIDAQNWIQRTPLMLAARLDMTETCRVLLKNKASIDLKDVHGNQAADFSTLGSECSKLLFGFVKENLVATNSESNEKPVWRKRINSQKKQHVEQQQQQDTEENREQTQVRSSIVVTDLPPAPRRDSGQTDMKSNRQRARDASQKLLQKIKKSRSQSFERRNVYAS